MFTQSQIPQFSFRFLSGFGTAMLKPIIPGPQELETYALVLVSVVLVILLCAAIFTASKFQSIKGR